MAMHTTPPSHGTADAPGLPLDLRALARWDSLAGFTRRHPLLTLVHAFAGDTPGLEQAVRACLDAGDWARARHHARALRRRACGLGASALGDVCWEIECAAQAGRPPSDAALARLRHSLCQARGLLRHEAERRCPSTPAIGGTPS